MTDVTGENSGNCKNRKSDEGGKGGKLQPKLRFKGFTDAWEQRALGELGVSYSGLSGKNSRDFGHGKASYITYLNVFNNPMASNQELDSIEVDYKQHEVKYGDVFFTISSETAQDVGMSSVWPFKIRNVYLNSFCFGLRVNTKFNLRYLASILRSSVYRKQIVPLAQGISRFNISKNKVLKTVISVPPIREQECIGSLFRCLDSLIAAAERKVLLLKKKKHA